MSDNYGYTFVKSRTRELTNILIGSALVWGVGASWLIFLSPTGFFINSILFLAAFILHEYAHKITAIRNGLYAEFKLQGIWALITFISIFLPFKLIAPGATVIYGYAEENTMGKIALWGPLTNIIMAIIIFPFTLISGMGFLWIAIYFNAFIAVFNLIPFSVLDGKKILSWNKRMWAMAFVASAALFAASFIHVP
ncbi:MAG: M50 family metallopeptidase [Nitrososphaerota archaeon]|nr:M50 family metallopeptidase [Nitrososphaerota archaeon]MDG6931310.1 M50 family metallopeptidase [Nitrososphaerota archaeon]